MNRTKKLRGGVKLTQMERLQLSSLKSNKIAGKVREMLDYLKVIIESGKREFKPEDKEKLDLLAKSTYEGYIDTFIDLFQGTTDLQASIKTAIGIDALRKHFENVKVLVKTLLENIKQEQELSRLKELERIKELERLKSQLPVPPAVKPDPLLPPEPPAGPKLSEPAAGPEPEIVEHINEESKIIGNLLAEIDILKSELVSKDITLEEKNREIVTAFSLLANGEKTKEELTREISASIEAQYNMQLKTITEQLQQVKDKHKQKTEQYSITQYETRIEQMTKKFEEMEDKLHILADEKEALTIKHTQLQNDYITEQEKNEKLKKDYIAEQEKNKLIQTLFNDEQAKTKSLEIDLSSLTNNNKLKETIIEGLQVNLDKITKENEELTKNLGLKDADNARLIAELDALKSSGKTNKNATEKTVSEQAVTIAGLTAELDAVKRQLGEEQEKNKALISEQANNLSEIDKLTQKINDEDASKQVLNAELEKLKTEKQLLDDKNKQLDDLYKILIKDGGEKDKLYKTLQEERDKLIIKIDELEKELKERNEKNEALQQGIEGIAAKVGNSEGDLKQSNDKNAELTAQLQEVNKKIVALETELEAKTKELSDLVESIGLNKPVSPSELASVVGNNMSEPKKEIERSKEEIASLKAENDKLTAENKVLTAKINEMTAELEKISGDDRTALSISTGSGATPQTMSTSGSVDPTGRAFKQIDPKTIMRYTIFKDLEILIQNIKKKEISNIISSLNDIIETTNELFPNSNLEKLAQKSKVKDINEMIVKIYQIIKPK